MRHVTTALLSPKFWQRSLCLLGISSLLTLNSCTRYDIDIADSPNNQSGFKYHLGQAPTAEISGIYYYANELGADVSYQLRFEATEATVQPLIQSLGLSNMSSPPLSKPLLAQTSPGGMPTRSKHCGPIGKQTAVKIITGYCGLTRPPRKLFS